MTVGIANLPNQTHRHAAKSGARFSIMTVGQSGLGKTTFLNTLFLTSLCAHKDESIRLLKSGVEIKVTEAELQEQGFKLKVQLIDTPGYNDSINNNNGWVPIVEYLEKQQSDYFNGEMKSDRRTLVDNRVHVCLYFIEPTGHCLKPLDIVAMKELCTRVNLVPVVAKADTLTPKSLAEFKNRLRDDFEVHGIDIFKCPAESDDEGATVHNKDLLSAMPFSVIGSEQMVEVGGKKVRGRAYPWGVAEVENEEHCDFKKLRSLLLRTHLLNLIRKTEDDLYENYRDSKLERGGLVDGMTPEQLRKDQADKMKSKEEQIRKKFTEQVKQEEARFKQLEEKLYSEGEELAQQIATKTKKEQALKEEVAALAQQVSAATSSNKKK